MFPKFTLCRLIFHMSFDLPFHCTCITLSRGDFLRWAALQPLPSGTAEIRTLFHTAQPPFHEHTVTAGKSHSCGSIIHLWSTCIIVLFRLVLYGWVCRIVCGCFRPIPCAYIQHFLPVLIVMPGRIMPHKPVYSATDRSDLFRPCVGIGKIL